MTDVTQEKFSTGIRALERFRRLIQVQYQPLLRAVTGNEKLEVEPHASGAFTDNKTVWLPVPLALGDETLEHDKQLCGQREAVTLKMLCPMCRVEDGVDGLVFHESAHITERSFEKVSTNELLDMVDAVFGKELSKLDGAQHASIRKRISACSGDVMEAARIIDTWLPFAVNAVEDIYVNRRLFQYREGTEVPLQVQSREVFEEGIESADGQVRHWRDNDKSAQAIISAYLIGHNMVDLGSHLDPACNLTDDPTLHKMMGDIPFECEVQERLRVAMELVIYLRGLGFCPPKSNDVVLPPPPQPKGQTPPPPPGGQGEPTPGQGESGDGDPQEGDGDDTEGDGDGSTASGDDAEESDDTEGDGDGSAASGDDAEESDGKGGGGDTEDDGDTDEGESGDDGASGSDGDEGSGQGGGESEGGDDADGEGESSGDGEGTTSPDGGASSDESGEQESLEAQTDAEIEEQARRAKELMTYVMGHDEHGPQGKTNSSQDELVVERVLRQEGFDSPSIHLPGGFDNVKTDEWLKRMGNRSPRRVEVPRNMLSPSLARLRVVFAENRKVGLERDRKSGSHLDTRHLYRAGVGDKEMRIFARKNRPKKRDWFVCIGLDFSGSTISNGADHATKMAAHAVGELLHELGIKFAMYSHTSGTVDGDDALEHVEIKSPHDHWKDQRVQDALFLQRGRGVNLDGHSLEQYRKVLESERATEKLMLYFTDGEMPNFNYDEELQILKDEIDRLKKRRIHLLGVGYRTDSPKRHGLETIRYDKPDDVASIVEGLAAHLR